MRRSLLILGASIMLIAGACTGGATQAPSTGGGTSAAPPASAPGGGTSAAPSADLSAITGTAKLSGWQSSDAENKALQDTVAAFQGAYPNVKVDYKVITGDYPTVMATNFASKNVPDASIGSPASTVRQRPTAS